MADFVKLDGYNVKDAAAGKSLSISGNQLSLLKADGTAASTVTIPAGMKVYHVDLQYKDTVTDQTQYNSILDAVNLGQGSWSVYSITEVLTGATVATTTKLKDLMEDGLVYVTASILFTAQGTNVWYSLDTHILDTSSHIAFTISNGVQNYVQGWLSVAINTHTNAITTTSITKVNAGGGGSSSAITSVNILCSSTGIWTIGSNQPVTATVDEVIYDGDAGQGTLFQDLFDDINGKFNNNQGIDLKISITGQDWSAEVISYVWNNGTLTIYFEIFAGSAMYKKYAIINSSGANSLSINSVQ